MEDNATAARLFQIKLGNEGYLVDVARDGGEGIVMANTNRYDLIAIDYNMPVHNGLNVLRELVAEPDHPPIIFVTAQEDVATAVEAMQLGAIDYVVKGRGMDYFQLLPGVIERAMERHANEQQRISTLEALQEHNRNLNLLADVAQTLTSSYDIGDITAQLVRTISQMVGVRGSSVWIWEDEPGGSLVCAGIYTEGVHKRPENLRLPAGEGIAGYVARTGETVNTAEARHDPRFAPSVDLFLNYQTTTMLAVPLRTRNGIQGVLELVNKPDGVFNKNDRILTEALATFAGIAIEHARLVHELRQIGSDLYARNEELDAFAHTVAHDLKNPITLVVGYADILRETYDATAPDEIREYLDTIFETGTKMSSIVESLLQLADVRGAKRIEVEPVDTGPLVDESLRRLEMSLQQHKVEILQPNQWPLAIGYGPWLEEVWFNYISNAIKYGGQPPTLHLGYDILPESMIRFWVKDNGHGFNQDDAEYIFMPHARLVRGNFIAGHGLGLSIVRRIVERLGGQVGATSEPGNGSLFWFTLPADTEANMEGIHSTTLTTMPGENRGTHPANPAIAQNDDETRVVVAR